MRYLSRRIEASTYRNPENGHTLSTCFGKEYACFMSKKVKKEDAFDPAKWSPEEKMKFEIASELGLADKVMENGWRSLTAKESGRIGGLMTKKKREMKKAENTAQ